MIHKVRKRKRGPDDESGDDEADAKYDIAFNESAPQPRGTILITLRNVPPYTLW